MTPGRTALLMAQSYITSVSLMARTSSKASVPMACDVGHCRVNGIGPECSLCRQLLWQIWSPQSG